MNRRKISWMLVFLLLFAVLGYLREFFFTNLNIILYMQYYGRDPIRPVPEIMGVFRKFDYATLYYAKYLFTMVWTLLFLALSYFTVAKLTGSRFFVRLLFVAYAVLVGASGAAMCYNYFVNGRFTGDEYTLSRWLMGVAQSPLICLILLASERLYKFSAKHDQKG